jgi:flavorubredoxin
MIIAASCQYNHYVVMNEKGIVVDGRGNDFPSVNWSKSKAQLSELATITKICNRYPINCKLSTSERKSYR